MRALSDYGLPLDSNQWATIYPNHWSCWKLWLLANQWLDQAILWIPNIVFPLYGFLMYGRCARVTPTHCNGYTSERWPSEIDMTFIQQRRIFNGAWWVSHDMLIYWCDEACTCTHLQTHTDTHTDTHTHKHNHTHTHTDHTNSWQCLLSWISYSRSVP